MAVTVTRAEPHERPILENLFQLYIHDFSEFWAGQDRGELQPDGRFEPYPLDAYWRDPDRIPYLIRVDDHLAGLVLVNGYSHSGLTTDHNVAEFFVVRKHRAAGVGLAAAKAVCATHPGQWEAAVARKNFRALAFWRKVAAAHHTPEELDLTTDRWDGPILRFISR